MLHSNQNLYQMKNIRWKIPNDSCIIDNFPMIYGFPFILSLMSSSIFKAFLSNFFLQFIENKRRLSIRSFLSLQHTKMLLQCLNELWKKNIFDNLTWIHDKWHVHLNPSHRHIRRFKTTEKIVNNYSAVSKWK